MKKKSLHVDKKLFLAKQKLIRLDTQQLNDIEGGVADTFTSLDPGCLPHSLTLCTSARPTIPPGGHNCIVCN